MKEATIRDFFLGAADPGTLAAEARDAVEPAGGRRRRIHIEDLPPAEEFTITAPMLVRLCDAVLAGSFPGSALETVAFAIVRSEHLRWSEDDELIGRVLYDWASADLNWDLNPVNVRMFRDWLTGEVRPPSEPEMSPDTLSGIGILGRTRKVPE